MTLEQCFERFGCTRSSFKPQLDKDEQPTGQLAAWCDSPRTRFTMHSDHLPFGKGDKLECRMKETDREGPKGLYDWVTIWHDKDVVL